MEHDDVMSYEERLCRMLDIIRNTAGYKIFQYDEKVTLNIIETNDANSLLSAPCIHQEREKHFIVRGVILELVNALKFKSSLPDINLIQLVQFVLLDAGGKLSDFITPSGGVLQCNMDEMEGDYVSLYLPIIQLDFISSR